MTTTKEVEWEIEVKERDLPRKEPVKCPEPERIPETSNPKV